MRRFWEHRAGLEAGRVRDIKRRTGVLAARFRRLYPIRGVDPRRESPQTVRAFQVIQACYMNTAAAPQARVVSVEDVQSRADTRQIPINQVGIKDINHPVR